MKVLLVSTGNLTYNFEWFISAFRNKIGTCEHLHINQQQSLAEQKKIFEQHRLSMSFDRFIAYYQHTDALSRLLLLFPGINQQTLLSLHNEQSIQRRMIARYARSNPWLRWTGSDQTSFDYYKHIGMDAYLLPPMSMTSNRPTYNRSRNKFICHIFSTSKDGYAASLPKPPPYCQYQHADGDPFNYIRTQVKHGDVVVLSAQPFFERQLIAEVATNGAAIVVPTSEVSIRSADTFMRRACIAIDDPAELTSLFEQIHHGNNTELLNNIFAQGQYCSPEAVATQLERIISHSGRDRNAYTRRSAWL